MGLMRGLLRRGPSSSLSWCDARSRLPKGEFLRPDMSLWVRGCSWPGLSTKKERRKDRAGLYCRKTTKSWRYWRC